VGTHRDVRNCRATKLGRNQHTEGTLVYIGIGTVVLIVVIVLVILMLRRG
jgi:uncharacterized membrane protein YidH (DUF202 family)